MSIYSAPDKQAFRRALGAFATGVTIVTTQDTQGNLFGVTINSFNSVSLDPPLVLWSLSTASRSFPAFRGSDHFVVNVLAVEQSALASHFAASIDNKFHEQSFSRGIGGAPVLDGVAAHFECRKVATHPGGDHVIYIGQVERLFYSEKRALVFSDGNFMTAQPLSDGIPLQA